MIPNPRQVGRAAISKFTGAISLTVRSPNDRCPPFFRRSGRLLDKSPRLATLLGCVEDQPNLEMLRLVAGLAEGSEAAFAELYERFGARLYRTALGLLNRREDAEDMVQEVFVALVRSREQLAGVRDLPAYLFVALRHAVARRAAKRRADPQPLVTEPQVVEPPASDPRSEALHQGLARLTAEQREVVALKIEGELTFAEIGRVLAISPHTAASRYRYALDYLRRQLKNE